MIEYGKPTGWADFYRIFIREPHVELKKHLPVIAGRCFGGSGFYEMLIRITPGRRTVYRIFSFFHPNYGECAGLPRRYGRRDLLRLRHPTCR